MIYTFKNSRNGEPACYVTTLKIIDTGASLTFKFHAEHTEYFCPYKNYNDPHFMGDVCEVFIGTDRERKRYYEIEVSPEGKIMLALITNSGKKANGSPNIKVKLVNSCFVNAEISGFDGGYELTLSFDKKDVNTGTESFTLTLCA